MMKTIGRLLIALALLTTGSFAMASPDQDHHRGRQGHDRGYDRGHDRGHDNRRWERDDRRWRGHDRRYSHYPAPPRYYAAPRYYAPHHPRWQRGHRYYGPSYVVRDYGHYRLRPPPRGYHWVRADNDFLLVALTTGIILDMALR